MGSSTAWFCLVIAGFLEIGFARAIKLMDGHKSIPWSIAFYVCVVLSFYFLEEAVREIPIGTAYAVWTGIGGVGVAIVGMVFHGDPMSVSRLVFLVLLVASMIGLKLTS